MPPLSADVTHGCEMSFNCPLTNKWLGLADVGGQEPRPEAVISQMLP